MGVYDELLDPPPPGGAWGGLPWRGWRGAFGWHEYDDPMQPATAAGQLPELAASPERSGAPALDRGSKFFKFFNSNYAAASRLGARLNVDPSPLLGLGALESDYGTSDDAMRFNNPLGLRPDGHTPLSFPSNDAAWDAWARMYGPRVEGVGGDVDKFLGNLQLDNRNVDGPTIGGDRRGRYNDRDPLWRDKVTGVIQGVRNRLPAWLGSRDGKP